MFSPKPIGTSTSSNLNLNHLSKEVEQTVQECTDLNQINRLDELLKKINENYKSVQDEINENFEANKKKLESEQDDYNSKELSKLKSDLSNPKYLVISTSNSSSEYSKKAIELANQYLEDKTNLDKEHSRLTNAVINKEMDIMKKFSNSSPINDLSTKEIKNLTEQLASTTISSSASDYKPLSLTNTPNSASSLTARYLANTSTNHNMLSMSNGPLSLQPALSINAPEKSGPVRLVTVRYNSLTLSQFLSICGSGPNMSWDLEKAIPLKSLGWGQYVFETEHPNEPFEFKILLNTKDWGKVTSKWEEGENHSVSNGKNVEIIPVFPK